MLRNVRDGRNDSELEQIKLRERLKKDRLIYLAPALITLVEYSLTYNFSNQYDSNKIPLTIHKEFKSYIQACFELAFSIFHKNSLKEASSGKEISNQLLHERIVVAHASFMPINFFVCLESLEYLFSQSFDTHKGQFDIRAEL